MSDSDISGIHDRLDTMLDKVAAVAGDVSAIKAGCKPCRDDIDAHSLFIDGTNGQKGAKTRLSRLEWLSRVVLGGGGLSGLVLGGKAVIQAVFGG